MNTKPRHYLTRINRITPRQLLLLRAEGWMELRAVLYDVASRFKGNTTYGVRLHFQHKNRRPPPIDSFKHDSGRTSVRAEYGYLKGSPNTNS
jgi:hypothetical protein